MLVKSNGQSYLLQFCFCPGGSPYMLCDCSGGGALLVCVFLGVLVSFCVSKAVFRKFLLGKVCGGVSVCVFFLLWGGLLVFWGGPPTVCLCLLVCAFFSPGGGAPTVCLSLPRVCLFSPGGGPPSVCSLCSLCCFVCFVRGCLKRAMVPG